jgi:tight adherence protein B
METRVLVIGLAALFGFASLYALTLQVAASLRRRNVAMAAQGESRSIGGLVSWRVRNGFAVLMPVADALLRVGRIKAFADELVELLALRGFSSTPRSALSVLMAALLAMGAAVGLATGSVVGAVACPVCTVCVLFVLVGGAADKRQDEIRDAVPDALDSMSTCFGSGFTLLQTFRQVAEDTPGALGETFARSAHVLEMGGSAEKALEGLREGAHASELAFVAVALDVQHQSGGAMRQVLDAAAETVKGELALRRSLRVQTAQAKLSARVVVVMPFILVAAFSLASPDFLTPFFSSAPGYALLTLALVMQVAGIMLVRRALSVEGVA